MAVTVVRTELMDNGFNKKIDQVRDFLGMNGLGLNLEMEVAIGPGDKLPPSIDFAIDIKEPHLGNAGRSSFFPAGTSHQATLVAGTAKYRKTISAASLGNLLIADAQLEMATVVRASDANMPATADVKFREPLVNGGWSLRGKGRQPKSNKDVSGDVNSKEPDAKPLMLAGGVELLTITPGRIGFTQPASTWGFIRSPADVFLYTGHAISGNLVTHDPHDQWLTPEELLKAWMDTTLGRSIVETHVVILNGCAALNPMYGLKWEKFLQNNNGPLTVVLGYGGTAPPDAEGGEAVAKGMAEKMAKLGDKKWDEYAKAWMEVNKANYRPNGLRKLLANARALDAQGSWTMSEHADGTVEISPAKAPWAPPVTP